VARRLGRKWIGIERDPDYARAAEERIARVQPHGPEAVETLRAKRAEPRIAFGTIVELGLLEAGTRLTDENGRVWAQVRADGSLALEGSAHARQGSIHRLGAEVQGKAACNGWSYWHIEVEGRRRPIDMLRQEARIKLGLTAPAVLEAAE
jgi:modification methylase